MKKIITFLLLIGPLFGCWRGKKHTPTSTNCEETIKAMSHAIADLQRQVNDAKIGSKDLPYDSVIYDKDGNAEYYATPHQFTGYADQNK